MLKFDRLCGAGLIFLFLLLLPGQLQLEAADIRSGGFIDIDAAEVIEEDLYLFGDYVEFSGTARGDLVVFAREAFLEGTVEGNLFVFVETARLTGDFRGSVRGGANTVTLSGAAGRDLMLAANTVFLSGAVKHDLLTLARRVEITGVVEGDVLAALSSLNINGQVGGKIDITAENLTLGPAARVEGSITYRSDREAVIAESSYVGGLIRKLDPSDWGRGPTAGFRTFNQVRSFISLLLTALLVGLLFPGVLTGTAGAIEHKPGRSLGYGALILFLLPVVSLLFLITVVGIPLSLVTLLLYLAFLYLSRVFAGYTLALLAFNRFGWKLHPVWTVLAGTLVLAFLIRIPYLGWVIHLAAVLFALGAFALHLSGLKKADRQTGETSIPGRETKDRAE